MDESVVVCFSTNNNHLKQIQVELEEFFGNSAVVKNFQNEHLLLESLKKQKKNAVEMAVIDLSLSDESSLAFVNSLHEASPASIKILIGKSKHLLKIQLCANDNSLLHYLKAPWTKTDMLLALNAAKTNLHFRQQINSELDRDNQLIRKIIEEEVSDRLRDLIEANHAKDRYLSIIAHDLKSPFLGLTGLTEILLNDWEDLSDENKLELISDLKKTSEDTYKLLEELLAWAKNQRDKLDVSIREIMVKNIVDSSIKIAGVNAQTKGIEVRNEISNNLKINADERMMATIFRNLISNAVKATRPGGKIKITARQEKNYCTFCVADNGEGIDKQDILELFNPKRSHSNGVQPKNNGNGHRYKGLGLILCKDFVERNGGKIWIETQKGMGSKFYFTLPS